MPLENYHQVFFFTLGNLNSTITNNTSVRKSDLGKLQEKRKRKTNSDLTQHLRLNNKMTSGWLDHIGV